MKVCTFSEFVSLPLGTVYSYWKPCVADGLYRKGKNYYNDSGKATDFQEWPLLPTPESEGSEQPVLYGGYGRWGIYDFGQLFAVYEAEDVKSLIELLTDTGY